MSFTWIEERPAVWDADKARIIGGEPPGIFDAAFGSYSTGDLLPGEWWRVEQDGRTAGYGWLDTVWGDAEILLAVAPEDRGRGAGGFILEKLEEEARRRGLNHLYNVVRPTHPRGEEVAAWLKKRGFEPSGDGSEFRAVVPRSS